MEFFNFGNTFISYLMLLYSKFELCTQNNGYTSRYFKKSRGINQGCNASPLVYVLCGEIMALLIKHNPDIKGITVNHVLNVLSQFADDTSFFLRYELLTIQATTEVLNIIEKNLGLQVSYDKTKLYRVGSLAGTNACMYTARNYQWTNEAIDLLGTSINCRGREAYTDKNWLDVMARVDIVCKDWYNRTLTLTGKIQVVNTLIASLFVYKMNVMLNLPPSCIADIEKRIRTYLWKGKCDKIPLEILQLKKSQGGQQLVHLLHRQTALKTRWVSS